MSNPISVKVSNRHQISLPSATRKRLNIQPGDQLSVNIQNNMLILLPQPTDFMDKLHQRLAQHKLAGIDTAVSHKATAWITNDKQHKRVQALLDVIVLNDFLSEK